MQALMTNRAPVGMQTKGLFGKSGKFYPDPSQNPDQPAMPGPIGGFGGGTFDMDGSQATPVGGAPMAVNAAAEQPGPAGGMTAPGQGLGARMQPQPEQADAGHWSVGGFDDLPVKSQAPAMPGNAGPLGASMRQPFDYDAAMKTLVGEYKKPKDWQVALAILGDGLAGAGGRQGFAVDNILRRKNEYQQRQFEAAKQILGWQQGDYAAQRDADLQAANPFTIGRDRVQFDPRSGQSSVVYDGAEDFELYAEGLGLEPGSEDYFRAVEDFILRGSGPSAYERDVSLDDHRTGNDRGLEGYRQENRLAMERARQGNRLGMEGARQSNRMTLRQTPAAGRGAGAAIQTVSTPAQAQQLKPGTRYRTPDGKVYTR